jgi:hypothetical protein
MKRTLICVSVTALMIAATALELEAQRRGGGGMRGGGGGMRGGGMRSGGMSRSMARPSVSRPASRPSIGGGQRPSIGGGQRPDIGSRGNIDRGSIGDRNISDRTRVADRDRRIDNNVDRDRFTNINNRPVNIGDIEVDGGWNNGWDGCCYRPLAGAAVGAAVGYATGVAVGSTYATGTVVYSLPSDCVVSVVNGITYEQCGSTWYQPQFSGTDTTYIVVDPPGSPSPLPAPSKSGLK